MTDDPKSLALAMVVLKFVADKINPAVRELRAKAGAALDARDRVTALGPGGEVLGTITKSAPKPVAEVTDVEAFTAWMDAHWPDRVEHGATIVPSMMDTAIAALRTYAPHVLRHHQAVLPWALAEVLRTSEAAKQPVGPGGELDVPGVTVTTATGTVSTRIDAEALPVLAELLASGKVRLDGTLRPELPGGAA
ncbi:hypothetical protein [Kutzneria chonburiensis]|uniref:Uncharacterized protein n=1 Tax=Kutzneria chonburiensis TaxID=1483604 RepID=A0ABV6N3D7_9PSEU